MQKDGNLLADRNRTTSSERRFFTQNEVADRFRVVPSTVVYWRKRGLLRYFQAPGSSRILYPTDAIEEFERQSIHREKEVIKRSNDKRERLEISPRSRQDWRI